jgi:N6-L-threonylcarbamoyladenine synthase
LSRPRLILGIETSCDETAASVVRNGRTVLSNIIASQNELHAEYRGVVPEIASRAHAERLLPVVRAALQSAGVQADELDAVAVGNRPGLIGSLLVGVAGAKAMALGLGIPFVGVDHVQAHLYAGLLGREGSEPAATPVVWPALGLVVSGGHTSMYVCASPTRLCKIGGTIDDAIGEAYDKVAAILDLGFPGGPSVDRLAAANRALEREPDREGFPIARLSPESLDFSFSGLKTAALYAHKGVPETERTRAKRRARGEGDPERWPAAAVAATFQAAAVRTITLKLERALDRHPECRTLLVGGGVSANSALRRALATLAQRRALELRLPAMEFCLDNAAMIAGLGFELLAERAWVGDDLALSATPTTGS